MAMFPASGVIVTGAPTREDVLKYFEEEHSRRLDSISKLQEEIVQLMRLRNSVVPINVLPAELFIEICSHLVQSAEDFAALIRATHVCFHWRTIALDAARLWTCFSLDDPIAATVFMRRSKHYPLSLCHKTSEQNPRVVTDLLLSEVHRLKVLHLKRGDHHNLRCLLDNLTDPAPKLEELVIKRTVADHTVARPFLVDRLLFSGDFRRLRVLTTVNVDVPITLSSPSPIPLLHLYIGHNRKLEIQDLLVLLNRCPLLETFRYCGISGIVADNAPPVRAVSLPKLEYMHVSSGTASRVAALVSHLTIPKAARVCIETSHHHLVPGGIDGYSMLPITPATHLQCLNGIKRLEVSVQDLPSYSFTLRAYHDPDVFLKPAFEIRALMSTDFSWTFMHAWPFDVSQVHTFVAIGLTQSNHVEFLRGMLHGLAALQVLRFVHAASAVVAKLLDLLSIRTQEIDGSDGSRSGEGLFELCPKMRSLELVDVPYHPSDNLGGSLFHMASDRLSVGVLEEVDLINVGGCSRGHLFVKLMKERLQGLTIIVDGDDELEGAASDTDRLRTIIQGC